ncbi:MAG: hypothetical protein WBG37_18820 [Desulfobacterales bacterium]
MPLTRIHKIVCQGFLILGLTALCFSESGALARIIFWTTEVETERLEIQEELAYDFTTHTGIQVKVIPVSEDHLATHWGAAGSAEPAPDLIYHPAYLTAGWADQGLLDVDSAHKVIQCLARIPSAPAP